MVPQPNPASPTFNIPDRSGPFVTAAEPTLTHHYQKIYATGCSCCRTFSAFWQKHNGVYPPLSYHTEQFRCPLGPLCSARPSPQYFLQEAPLLRGDRWCVALLGLERRTDPRPIWVRRGWSSSTQERSWASAPYWLLMLALGQGCSSEQDSQAASPLHQPPVLVEMMNVIGRWGSMISGKAIMN